MSQAAQSGAALQPIAEAPQAQSVGLIIGAVAVTLLLASLGQTIVSTALPTIVGELGGLDHLTWVVIAYLLSSTVVAPIYGKLGDLYGRKIVLQAAIVIFLIGASLSAFASSMTFLIIARTVQGLGGGGLMVVAMTVVADVIPPRQRGKIQGIFGAVFGVATVVGPLLGGVIVEHLNWQWIFLINLPLGILTLVVISAALKTNPDRVSHKIDYMGFVLLTTALSSFVLATSLGGNTFAWLSAQIIGLVVLSLASVAAFIWVESRAAEPVLPLKLFRNNTFVITNAVGFLVGMAMFGSITFLPLYLQVAKGVTPTGSAIQLIPMMVGLIGASTLAGFAMSKTGRYKLLPIASTAVLVVGLTLLGTMHLGTPDWQIALFMFMVGAGIGPVNSVGVTATQNAVSRDLVGVATAGNTLFRQIGGSIGVSVFGAIFTSSLASQVGGAMPEGGGGAFNAAAIKALPDAVRVQVVEGFSAALHPVFLTAAAAAVIACGLAFMLKELPLATSLRKEPEAEIDAEERAMAAAAGAPAE
ncbi:drug resistance transporter, EmrB/QacA subfamily [Devosia sp. YR412]|uniref:MDR family MFS transporter n=1 Tax=Devosia sp. YR412 TaxID=1881030 RepID=UPI0008CB49FA|nr:MDR family MFS transporter [Devosia sp. YR412]SEP71918.1 drug resistance transporter, EmrB/QacA subfamily [Devosia sp. YR412]